MFLAVDESGRECIYESEPQRGKYTFSSDYEYVEVPKGTIQRLLNYPLTWEDDCQEIVEYKNNSTLNDDDIQRNIIFAPNADEHLRQKIVNLHDQLNKSRKAVQNQKEELTRLLNQKKQLNNRLDIYALCNDNQKINITNLLAQKEELQYKLDGVTNLVELSIQNDDLWAKQLEEKDAIIKYLESKLKI